MKAPPQPWTDRKVVLLGIGDSVTRGLGADSPSHGYFERLRINPEDEFPDMQGKCLSAVIPNLTAENVAVSGSTSIDHLHTLQNRVDVFPDDVFGLVVWFYDNIEDPNDRGYDAIRRVFLNRIIETFRRSARISSTLSRMPTRF